MLTYLVDIGTSETERSLTRNLEQKLISERVTLQQTPDEFGSVHRSKIHTEKSKKMQQFIKILLFHIYMKHNMFRATHCPSSGG
jgi:hypothetical protein